MRDKSKRWALFVSCAVLFCVGLLASAVGPVLPDLARQTGSDLASLGSAFTVLFLGSLLTQMVTGAATDRLGHKPVLMTGLLVCALGIITMALSNSILFTLVGAGITGLGEGVAILSANLFVAQVFASESVAALNLANVFFGVGAVAGPFLAGLFLANLRTALPVLWLTALFFVLLLPLVLRVRAEHSRAGSNKLVPSGRVALPVFTSPAIWAFGLMLLVYVGTEAGTGGWLVTYITHSTTLPADVAAIITSAYWMALTAGRLVASFVGRSLSGNRLLFASLCGALLGGSLLVVGTGSVPLTILGALVLGLCLGPIYPTVVAVVAALYAANSGKAASMVMVMGSMGGLAIPWLLGVLILQSGPRWGMMLVAGCALSMLLLCVGAVVLTGRALSTGSSTLPAAVDE